jgi:glucose 1-dehydrogenase
VTSSADMKGLVDFAVDTYGGVDVLVNSAGVQRYGTVADTEESVWDEVLGVNLKGIYLASRYAIPEMRERGGGTIVNVSSVQAIASQRGVAAYTASKGGINALTIQLAVELAPDQIRVNAFAPGATNVQRNLDDDPSYRESWAPLIPLGRIAEPEDMVGPTVFLASEESSHVTGQLFYVDGGWTSAGRVPEGYVDLAERQQRER